MLTDEEKRAIVVDMIEKGFQKAEDLQDEMLFMSVELPTEDLAQMPQEEEV